jgi:phage baseplate assembly protein V
MLNDLFKALLRARNMIKHAVIGSSDDTGKWQRVQIEALDGEVRHGIPVFQSFGFASNPDTSDGENPEALVVHIGGRPDGAVVIQITDRRYRPKNLQPGETAMYDKAGSIITMQTNGDIVISSGSGELKINDNVTVTGDLHVQGGIKSDADIVAHRGVLGDDVSLISHKHGVNATADTSTGVVTFTAPSNPAVPPSGTTGTPDS